MNKPLESILDDWDQESKLQEESFDQLESEYDPLTTAWFRVCAFPHDEPYVPEGDGKFDLLEDRIRELGRILIDQRLYPWLKGLESRLEFQKRYRLAAVKLLMEACERIPKGKLAGILRKENEHKHVFHHFVAINPEYQPLEQSPTICYGIYEVWRCFKTEDIYTPPLVQKKLADHADVSEKTIGNWIRSGDLIGIGGVQKREWHHTDKDVMFQILESIQDEMLPRRKKSQKSPKKSGNKKPPKLQKRKR